MKFVKLTTDQDRDLLQKKGIKFREEVIQLDQIDLKRSAAEQWRIIHDTEEERVIEMGSAMLEGHAFPPITVLPQKSGSYLVISGLHRTKAAIEATITSLPAYIIDPETPEHEVYLFALASNASHGKPTSTDDRIQQGCQAARQFPQFSIKEIANNLNLKPSALAFKLKVEEARQRVAALPIKAEYVRNISDSAIDRLASIRSDVVLTRAANLVGQTKMQHSDVVELIPRVNQCRSEDAALTLLAEREAEMRPFVTTSPGGRIKLSATLRAVLSIKRAITTLKKLTSLSKFPARERSALAKSLNELYQHLGRLAKSK